MKCMYCKGSMVHGSSPFHIDRRDVHVSLDRVPAWVCTQCGEVYFEKAEVDAMQDIVRAVDAQADKLAHMA